MATADVDIHVYTAGPVDGGSVSGISFLSVDSALSTPASRTSNPISAGDRSYEKWLAAVIGATAPDNWVNDFHVWGDGDVMADTDLYVGFNAAWSDPTNAVSGVAATDFTTYTSAAKGNWHTSGGGDANLVNVGDKTKYLVFQLAVGATHPGGAWTQEVIYYDYTET
jgi:hypothetical protein